MRQRRLLMGAAVAVIAIAAAACTSSTSGSGTSTATPTSTPATTATTPPATSTSPTGTAPSSSSGSSSPAPGGDAAARELARMSLAERVGQLFMVDCPSTGVASATVSAVQRYHVGSVILDNNSTLGLQRTRAVTDQLQGLAPADAKLFISTDQEGGLVQRLKGAGFSAIPSAVQQGEQDPSALRRATARWAGQLRGAGVNVDLAPVLDTVPPGRAPNPPIGDLDREYGRNPQTVAQHGVAVAQGIADAGVDATAKHFPGLGRVAGNTDTTSGVTDSVTTENDAYLQPYAAAVQAHVPFVMIATAIYSRIDPGTPAIFSKTIVTGMLRQQLGFRGVIITDDVGAAKQVLGYSPGQRAVGFLRAGGTMVLTVVPSEIAQMTAAVIAQAKASPAFAAVVDAAALVVLRAKQARGLLG